MSVIMELLEVHPEGEGEEGFRFECGGGRVGVEACADRMTPYGGLAAWSHYLERIGIVEDLARRCPIRRTSPNATPVRDILHGFIAGILMGGRRFAHMRRLQDDRARGSHHPLLCVVAGTRLALHMEWRPGNAVSATAWQEAMEKVWSHPDVRAGLKLNRGDIGFA